MRKNSTTTPQTPAQPNAPVMSQVSPVKAMPAPVPSGATTSPPMNQAKMADEKEEKASVPSGTKGGLTGALIGALASAPGVAKARKAMPPKPPSNMPSHLYDKRRGDLHKSVAKALGTSLAGAAVGVGVEHLGKHMSKVIKDMRDIKAKDKA